MENTLTERCISEAIQILPSPDDTDYRTIRPYESCYFTSIMLAGHGIETAEADTCRPLLLLAGTSIPIDDRLDLIRHFLNAGYEVASIGTAIGGLFDVALNPRKDRPDSLKHYLKYLIEEVKVNGIDILAQSYSAFEVLRVLLENPSGYRRQIKSITFINPPGLNENIGLLKHSFRFIWHHVARGYLKAYRVLSKRTGSSYDAQQVEFLAREMRGIKTWTARTFTNPVRMTREVLDIIAYRIGEPLAVLQNNYGYDINIFLQSDDQLLPVEISLARIRGLIPDRNIRVVPGGHNDLFIQEWQRNALLDFIRETRARRPLENSGYESPVIA